MQASLLDKRDHQIDAPFYAVMQGLDLGLWTLTTLRILQTWSDWRTRCGLNETLHVVIQLFGVSLCTYGSRRILHVSAIEYGAVISAMAVEMLVTYECQDPRRWYTGLI